MEGLVTLFVQPHLQDKDGTTALALCRRLVPKKAPSAGKVFQALVGSVGVRLDALGSDSEGQGCCTAKMVVKKSCS